MRVTKKHLPKSVIELAVEIPADEVLSFSQKALRRLAQHLELPGFRKGKVPSDIAAKYLSPTDIFAEAAEIMVNDTYPQAILQEKLEPIGQPEIDIGKADKTGAFAYTAKVAVLPEVGLPDYRKFKVKEKKTEIADAEVDDALRYLQKSRATFLKADREARAGDLVEIDFVLRQNGVPFEGGSASHHPFILGEGRFIPGFEDAIAGMRADEEKTFDVSFPADYTKKDLAGKPVTATVKLHSVLERALPELTDDFAKGVGAFQTLGELRASIADGLQGEKSDRERRRVEVELITQIAEKSKMQVPDVLLEREIGKMFLELESRLAGGGVALADYLAHLKKTREDLSKEFQKEAEKRVRIALALRAVGRAEGIRPTPQEVAERARKLQEQDVSSRPRPPQDAASLREYAEQIIVNERVFDLLYAACITRA